MGPTPVPTRITIDFRDAMHPSRTWILGIGEETERAELLAFRPEPARVPTLHAAPPNASAPRAVGGRTEQGMTWASGCTCPEFCERDHANE